jgi:4-amino-4-deoxy-L-arabinose transferase-like glycosyltransferase
MIRTTLLADASALQTREEQGSVSPSLFGRLTYGLVVGALGVLVLLPAVVYGIPDNYDLANHYHFALPFYDAIAAGDLYPGWLATSNHGYGDPLFRFYPPGLYYLLAAIRALTGNWYTASLATFTLLSVIGAGGAYFWARTVLPRQLAVWASAFYVFMPYRVAEVYQAAQLAEFAAGVALLFAFAFTKRICRHRRWVDVCGLAVSYSLLLLTHLPLAVLGSISILLYALLNIETNHKLDATLKLALGAVTGAAASAFYWTTVLAEMKWIIGDGAHPSPLLDYRANFVFSTFSPEKSVTLWWMSILTIITLLMCLPAVGLIFGKFSEKRRWKDLVSIALLLVFALIMATALSKPVWFIVPYLRMVQHPFRWLAVVSAAVPLLMAASLPRWLELFRSRKRSLALGLLGMVLISITFTISQVIRAASYLPKSEFEEKLQPLRQSPTIVQWLPIWASLAAQDKESYEKCVPPAEIPGWVAAGDRSVNISRWDKLERSFLLGPGIADEVKLQTFYYPHWTATAGGQKLSTRPAEDGSLVLAVPGNSSVTIHLEFVEPARTKVANVISAFSWTLMGFVLILVLFRPATGKQIVITY